MESAPVHYAVLLLASTGICSTIFGSLSAILSASRVSGSSISLLLSFPATPAPPCPASATQLTLAEPVQGGGGAGGNERSKLMEEPDTLEADKIAESEPKIVLQMPVDASSKTA